MRSMKEELFETPDRLHWGMEPHGQLLSSKAQNQAWAMLHGTPWSLSLKPATTAESQHFLGFETIASHLRPICFLHIVSYCTFMKAMRQNRWRFIYSSGCICLLLYTLFILCHLLDIWYMICRTSTNMSEIRGSLSPQELKASLEEEGETDTVREAKSDVSH